MIDLFKKISEEFEQKEVHERIRFLRKQKNYTIKEAAEKSITTEKCWSDWERGKAVPRDSNKKAIASVLGVNVNIIFGKSEKIHKPNTSILKELPLV